MKKMIDDKLINSLLISCLLLFSFMLLFLFKLLMTYHIETNRDLLNEDQFLPREECLFIQMKCYKENGNIDEEEKIKKCKEIDFCSL